jgi:hypothetical protein
MGRARRGDTEPLPTPAAANPKARVAAETWAQARLVKQANKRYVKIFRNFGLHDIILSAPNLAAGIRRELWIDMNMDELLQSDVKVVNIGLPEFARDLERTGTPVIRVDWSPPPSRDPKIASLLAKLGG